MRILLKCPTRSRPQRVLQTISRYVELANNPSQIGIAISCDTSDETMKPNLVQDELYRIAKRCEWCRIFFSENTSKIQACNANMNEIEYPWDIVVLVSDDMIPQMKGYDDIIRNNMLSKFSTTDGILWFNDGTQGEKLNTLTMMGRKMYEWFGYLYNPEYKSLFCDTELTDLCRSQLKEKTLYIPYCIIRHEHPGTGFPEVNDALYQHNQRFWTQDMMTYIRRKQYEYDWSILIPTLCERQHKLNRLLKSIHEKCSRIAPWLKYDIQLDCDNRETSVGAKRDRLLKSAKGKYLSFIDDDDEITDAYIEDLVETIRGHFHVMRLRGKVDVYTFTHSIKNTLNMPMAIGDEFLRPPNHLNPMLSDIAKFIPFQNAQRGEDLDWTIRLAQTGFLKTEYTSADDRIHYNYNIAVPIHPSTTDYQRKTTYQDMLKVVWLSNGPVISQTQPQPQPQERGLRLGRGGFVSR